MKLSLATLLLACLPQDDVESKVKSILPRLKADSIEERDAAQKALVELGEPAIPVLEKEEARAEGEVQKRIRAALHELYLARSLRTLPERWKDAWLSFEIEGKSKGYWHTRVTETKEGLRIDEEVAMIIPDDRTPRRAGWTSQALCKKDRHLTPIRATCTTRVEGKTVMEVSLEFKDGRVRSSWSIHRDKRKPDEIYDPPKKGTREKEVGEHPLLQTAAFPFYSLLGRPDASAEIRFIEFPDDLDEDITVKSKKIEYVGTGEVEIDGKKVEAFEYRVHLADRVLVTREGAIVFTEAFRWTTEKEARALLGEK
ncbi:MAG: hypothetical protein HYY17_04360 [Planctomycetes bacterium]|nr:hypothetical protein [Planctomycetota bacterium]